MRNIVDVLIGILQVVLLQADSERQNFIAVRSETFGPHVWFVFTFLVRGRAIGARSWSGKTWSKQSYERGEKY